MNCKYPWKFFGFSVLFNSSTFMKDELPRTISTPFKYQDKFGYGYPRMLKKMRSVKYSPNLGTSSSNFGGADEAERERERKGW